MISLAYDEATSLILNDYFSGHKSVTYQIPGFKSA